MCNGLGRTFSGLYHYGLKRVMTFVSGHVLTLVAFTGSLHIGHSGVIQCVHMHGYRTASR
jgi:hypothetical protein